MKSSPRPWRFELGIVYDNDGNVVADNIGIADGPLVEAAPTLLWVLSRTTCHACTYRIGDPREGPGCSACDDAREALARAVGSQV